LTDARQWPTTLAVNSMRAEAYALRVEDVKEAVALAQPPAHLLLRSTRDAGGPGIALR
jgi:hypothetical protein